MMDIENLLKELKRAERYCLNDYSRMAGQAATALSTLQAENEKLRAELEQVRYEKDKAIETLSDNLRAAYQSRDAAIKELNGVSSLVDDLAEFVDREIYPVVDYNLYLDLRENVDAVSMFQHEDEWRGLHKEE